MSELLEVKAADLGLRLDEKPRSDLFPTVRYDSEKEVVEEEGDEGNGPPAHPLLSMQGPFEESIAESTSPDATNPSIFPANFTLKQRHQRLLDGRDYNDTYNARWRKNSKQNYHPLWKIAAQIVFGVHLLQQQLAKSDEEVVRILQRHVDEVDTFIQRTGEDLETTLADVRERINYLELPLQHAAVFDQMLEDKQFRMQIISGNELIEGVIARTAELLNDYLVDINKGKEVTKDMSHYLTNIECKWPEGSGSSSFDIFKTMQANADGWLECCQGLQMKANRLGAALVQLGNILNEMQARAGVASRRVISQSRSASRAQSRANSRPGSANSQRRKESMTSYRTPASRYARSAQKPLPEDPEDSATSVKSPRTAYSKASAQRSRTPNRALAPVFGEPQELPAERSPISPLDGSQTTAFPTLSPLDRTAKRDLFLGEFGEPGSRSVSRQSSRRQKEAREESSVARALSASRQKLTRAPSAGQSVKSKKERVKPDSSTMFDSAYASGDSDQNKQPSPIDLAAQIRPSTAPESDAAAAQFTSRAAQQNMATRGAKLAQLTGGLDPPLVSSTSMRMSHISLPSNNRRDASLTIEPQLQRRTSAPEPPARSLKRKPSLGNFGLFKRFFSFKWTRGKNKKKGMNTVYEIENDRAGKVAAIF